MDYYDDNPVKVNKFLMRLEKIRKKERKMKRVMKAAKKKLAEAALTAATENIIKTSVELVATV